MSANVLSRSSTLLLSFFLCIFVTSESLFVGFANSREETKPNSTKMIFLAELVKMTLSIIFLSIELCCFSNSTSLLPRYTYLGRSAQYEGFKHLLRILASIFTSYKTLLFGIPALAYFINNNLTFTILSMMDPPTFSVLSNLKILTTGFFSYLFLKRQLSSFQWISLGLLFFGATIAQINYDQESAFNLTTSTLGLFLIFVFSSISAGASVFTEFVMKDKFENESIHLQNIKLYLFGILFNGFVYFSQSSSRQDTLGFFESLRPIHFCIIMSICSMGLVTSAIIKYAGSITKVYAGSMAMFFSTFVSYLLLDFQPTAWFFMGAFLCCIAVHMYYTNPVVTTNNGSLTPDGHYDEKEVMYEQYFEDDEMREQ
ncbi:10890_t:CDS:2 [Ambispora leptoticha]|uniref:10890_t:CDS:1 n=1 Tax=Ambispora leptoticha TaxID=144679 RepID=A0A9N8ZEN1_9GLOM|nr:10890_t:CDS:2 [Ambispora leptoticha]